MTTFQKVVKYLALGFAVCLTVFIVTIILDVIFGVIDGVSGKGDSVVTESYTYDNLNSIDLEIGFGDVSVRSEGTQFIVNANEVLGFDIKESNGSLKIDTGSRTWGSNGSDASIEVIVPENYTLDKLDVEVGAGQCTISNISAEKADFEIGTGELSCSGLSIQDCKVDSGVGAVNMSFAESIDSYSIILDKGIGSAEINGESYNESTHKNNSAPNKIDVDCGIGGIELNFAD